MNHRPSVPASNSRIINGTALGFSILFLLPVSGSFRPLQRPYLFSLFRLSHIQPTPAKPSQYPSRYMPLAFGSSARSRQGA